MENIQMPLQIEGINDNIYAGFGSRFASLILDFLIVIPVVILILYLNGLSVNAFFYTLIPNLLFGLWFQIYLPKKYGGTPGKLIMGIKIIQINGKPIDWKEAFLRHSVLLVLTLFSSILMVVCLLKADETVYNDLGWIQRSQYLMSLSPIFFLIYTWASNIWIYSEFIVLLTNPRKRAVHDYIAGTVIVKQIYIDRINEIMYPNELSDNNIN
ncbi:RDD family protein [Flavobacterium sp.]|uniref:RDD family protein n=1 Tax=Flavobacterium sp. TaxID=239 RepID=UPI002B4B3E77|nr:RDD family protein [Flavobacterium sp.]HLF51405.1 RDD family protein [Flavobacterium sp.]